MTFLILTIIRTVNYTRIKIVNCLKNCLENCLENCLKNCLKDCLTKNFHDLHACFIREYFIGFLKNWIYDKRYMEKAHATSKFVYKIYVFKILVVEVSIEKEKNNVTISICQHLILSIWYHMTDITWHMDIIYRFKRFANRYHLSILF